MFRHSRSSIAGCTALRSSSQFQLEQDPSGRTRRFQRRVVAKQQCCAPAWLAFLRPGEHLHYPGIDLPFFWSHPLQSHLKNEKRKINKKWFPAARAGLCESEGETVGDQLRGSDKGQVTKKIIIIDVISFCVTSGKDQKQGKDPRSKKPSPSNLAFSTPGRKGRSSQNFLRQPSFMRLKVILL